MAHRQITSLSKVGRTLKNGLLTGNFNIVAQVQPRQPLSHSSVHFSHESQKGSDKCLVPIEGNNGSAAKIQEMGAVEESKIVQRVDNASSISSLVVYPILVALAIDTSQVIPNARPYKFPPTIPKENPKFSDESGRDRVAYLVINIIIVVEIVVIIKCWWVFREKSNEESDEESDEENDKDSDEESPDESYEEITWNDFVYNYYTQGRVAKVESLDDKWLRVLTAPGASADGAKTFKLKIDSMDLNKNVVPMAKTLENSEKEMKAEPLNYPPPVDKQLHLCRQCTFFILHEGDGATIGVREVLSEEDVLKKTSVSEPAVPVKDGLSAILTGKGFENVEQAVS